MTKTWPVYRKITDSEQPSNDIHKYPWLKSCFSSNYNFKKIISITFRSTEESRLKPGKGGGAFRRGNTTVKEKVACPKTGTRLRIGCNIQQKANHPKLRYKRDRKIVWNLQDVPSKHHSSIGKSYLLLQENLFFLQSLQGSFPQAGNNQDRQQMIWNLRKPINQNQLYALSFSR